MRRLVAAIVVVVALAVVGCSARSAFVPLAPSSSFTAAPYISQRGSHHPLWEFFKPRGREPGVAGIAVGADGAIWATEIGVGKLVRVDMSGAVSEFTIKEYHPYSLAAGSDGYLYITGGNGIAKFGLDGTSKFYKLSDGLKTIGDALGPDKNIWFSANTTNPPNGASEIDKITPAGRITEYPIPPNDTNVFLSGVTAGADGNIWWASANGGQNGSGMIGNINPRTGVVTEYHLGSRQSCNPLSIAQEAGGDIWFTCEFTGPIGRITRDGAITWFSANVSGGVNNITPGRNHDMWFVGPGELATISDTGTVRTFTPPGGPSNNVPDALVVGPDRNVWYTDLDHQAIGVHIMHRLDVTPSSLTFSQPGQSQSISVSETDYHGSWSATSSDPSIATVAPQGSDQFLVTSVGAGSCTITVSDSMNNMFPVDVTVESPHSR